MQKQQFARIQSPSSINTYKQCPRKYYYQYIAKLKTRPSIHLTRGKITHSVLEDFFRLKIESISPQNFGFEFSVLLQDLLKTHWKGSSATLSSLGLGDEELKSYLEETKEMLASWLDVFMGRLRPRVPVMGLSSAFHALTPVTEQHFLSNNYGVQGYIDAIFNIDNEIRIIDYKTSKHDIINEGYRLQLAIYAALYKEKNSRMPDKAGIHFLKHGERLIDVDEKLIMMAKSECEMIHKNTASGSIDSYPKNTSPLCKWSTGQCDFYEECQKGNNI